MPVSRWSGGEKYGRDNRLYYAEYRGVVRGARAGDSVRVFFAADQRQPNGRLKSVWSKAFTYEVEQATGADVLVIADEDYDGVNPTYAPPLTGPKYARTAASMPYAPRPKYTEFR